MKKNIFFDLDGTLLDSKPGIARCINHALVELGSPARDEEDIMPMIGPPLAKGFPTLLGSDDSALIAKAISLYRARYDQVGIYESSLFAGVTDMLADLAARDCQIYLVTAKPQPYAVRILGHFSIDAYFRGIFAPTMDDKRDGKGHLVNELLTSNELDHRASAMIGDRDRDIAGGRDNGVTAIGVLWGYGTRQELISSGAEFLVESPKDLLEVLGCSTES